MPKDAADVDALDCLLPGKTIKEWQGGESYFTSSICRARLIALFSLR